MSGLVAGILFDSSILQTPAFQAFSIFVAFNTLVYLGLTGCKLFRWVPQKKGLPIHESEPIRRQEAPAIRDVLAVRSSAVRSVTPGRDARDLGGAGGSTLPGVRVPAPERVELTE